MEIYMVWITSVLVLQMVNISARCVQQSAVEFGMGRLAQREHADSKYSSKPVTNTLLNPVGSKVLPK